ncbi:mRNA interferase RelE/StbE [Methanofollis sp. W23]|uniref:type II toxin-antitoxin system RelE family toxin n=1 Tax=Methanofollis sp. W23 TaxID=2817849 RepID=UPI001AE21D2F|nr:type II toxin-antitoxin system RelE/ParE family toxin [Methanofollis sp. W23]MBP2145386.1 mRNA interferase RelE/StbE [Methanofollis sp. W23]
MIWRIVITPGAERDFTRFQLHEKQRIKNRLYQLAEEPHPRRHLKKLKGHQDSPLYSLRVGRFRILLALEDDTLVIIVIEIGDRRNIYKSY